MSKHDEAALILELYDLRREPTMRKARDWYFREFFPESASDIRAVMFGEHSAYFRMVTSYWEMAAALVNHGAIGIDLFTDTNGEHFGVFSKVEPYLTEMRAEYNPQMLSSLERLIDATPNGRQTAATVRERMKAIRAELAARQGR